ncbi:zona pellucida-like domain-containing protein 1 [Tachysurus fulvidraco]|uniref:zona pellucida-like domain-containing protein 1 n=1 Tax=Tachysurus fulvidraco TaxID=1234273 RepID=UPI000F5160CD|nr:zona pellucida-like domain-containing protein 1 [Tachysurus fulvidraco]XP_047660972.1 zona pellucida-like domain-containing protein 1 [Tachysurus fulvidraco]
MFLQLYLLFITVAAVSSQTTLNCAGFLRLPDYNDISVDCGTSSISLTIQICPAIYAGYNETSLFVNSITNDPSCKGTLDNSVVPPVLRFTFPIGTNNSCGSNLNTTSAAGTGIFADFSNIQSLNISGVVRSYDTSVSVVTYNTDLKYFYSCAYPLQYLINNTRLDVSSSAIAVRDRNGSFISTLSLKLYSDANYTMPLVIPTQGIQLKSNVFVMVQATNLTSQYYVLLDRCYASVSRYPTSSTFYNLFVGCTKDPMTNVTENGMSQTARFYFPAFRFTEQQNQSVSSYYLHCITRLCESSACVNFRSCAAGRRRRDLQPTALPPDGLTESTLLTSPIIFTKSDINAAPGTKDEQVSSSKTASDSSVALGVTVGILAFACLGIIVIGAIFYKKLMISGVSKILC